jgi:hypothetical protein
MLGVEPQIGATTFSIMAFSIMAFSGAPVQHNGLVHILIDTQHKH